MDPEMNMSGKRGSRKTRSSKSLVESNGGYTDNLWVPHYGTHR